MNLFLFVTGVENLTLLFEKLFAHVVLTRYIWLIMLSVLIGQAQMNYHTESDIHKKLQLIVDKFSLANFIMMIIVCSV